LTEAQSGLLKKAHRALEFARLLLADGDFDRAASRAYYVMLHVSEAVLLSKGLAFSSHAAVMSAFGKEFASAGLLPREHHRYLIDDLRRGILGV
jgi:uncharacterized protein (UPF0332 family)